MEKLAEALKNFMLEAVFIGGLDNGDTIIRGDQLKKVVAQRHEQGSGPSRNKCWYAFDDGTIEEFLTDTRVPIQVIRIKPK